MITTLKSGAILLASTLLLTACGGDSSSSSGPAPAPDPDPVTDDGGSTSNSTGVFSDSPVAGIAYLTNPSGQEGTTNAAGEYDYQEGDSVQFSVGNIDFPSVSAKGKVTPLDMGGDGADLATPEVVNVIRLLQTLDDDGDPENGISVSADTATALADTSLDFSSNTFESEATAAATSLGRELVTEDDAVAHFSGSLRGDILGSWLYEEETGNVNLLTFFGDNRYVIAHSEADDGDQTAGSAEYGTYSWDPVSGDFSVSLIRETDGSGGLYNVSEPNATQGVTLTIAEGVLTLTLDDEAVQFTAIQSEDDDLTGAWFLPEGDGEGDSDGGVLLTFDGSNYVLVHTWNTEAYDGAEPLRVTSEWNTYERGADGSFSVDIPSVETDGPGGLFNQYGNEDEDSPLMLVRTNGGLDYQINPEDTIAFAPVASFEVELKDLEGDARSAPVKRAYGRFASGTGASYVLNKIEGGEEGSYGIVLKEGTNSLTLNSDGTGSIEFSESDVNDVTWEVSSSGVLHFTETDGSGDQWFWVVTPIKSRSHTAALVEVTTPEGQEDSADVSYIAQVQDAGFKAEDFSGLVYNIFEDTGIAYTSTLTFDPSTGTLDAVDGEDNAELSGEYSLEAGGKVLQIDFAGALLTNFIIYREYDPTLGAYKACWIDEEDATDLTTALAFADANPAECFDYLTTDADRAETIQAIVELTAGGDDAGISTFDAGDFDGLLYNVYQDAEGAYVTTLTVDANGSLVADDGDGSATGMEADYQFESGGSVVSIDWKTGPLVGTPSFMVFDGYSASASAYRMVWINDEEVTTVSEALAYEDPENVEYLTPDLGMAKGLKSIINGR